MNDKIIERISQLQTEITQLVGRREEMLGAIQEIEVRIHQISGAMKELSDLVSVDKD